MGQTGWEKETGGNGVNFMNAIVALVCITIPLAVFVFVLGIIYGRETSPFNPVNKPKGSFLGMGITRINYRIMTDEHGTKWRVPITDNLRRDNTDDKTFDRIRLADEINGELDKLDT